MKNVTELNTPITMAYIDSCTNKPIIENILYSHGVCKFHFHAYDELCPDIKKFHF